MDEAIEWAKRCPNPTGEESVLEIRPVFELDDFGDNVTPEVRERDERLQAAEPEASGRSHAPIAKRADRGGLADRVAAADRRR